MSGQYTAALILSFFLGPAWRNLYYSEKKKGESWAQRKKENEIAADTFLYSFKLCGRRKFLGILSFSMRAAP